MVYFSALFCVLCAFSEIHCCQHCSVFLVRITLADSILSIKCVDCDKMKII